MDPGDLDPDEKFIDIGLDSVTGVEWVQAINRRYNVTLTATRVYDYPNLGEFAKYLAKQVSLDNMPKLNNLPVTTGTSKPSGISENAGAVGFSVSMDSFQEELTLSLAGALSMNANDITPNEKFVDIGLDSITGVEWIQAVNRQYGTTLTATKVYDYPSIREFAGFLQKELNKKGGVLGKVAVNTSDTYHLDDVLQQVQSGLLDIEQANELLSQF